MAQRFPNCEIFAFDPTPKAIAYAEAYDKSIFPHFSFYSYGLSDNKDKVKLYLPKNLNYVSGSKIENDEVNAANVIKVQMHTLRYLMSMLQHISIDLLKMDIEGSEFKVLLQILDERIEIGQICVEFHNRFFKDRDEQLNLILGKLRERGWILIHISDRMEEFTSIHAHVLL